MHPTVAQRERCIVHSRTVSHRQPRHNAAVRVACVQDAPVFLDREATTARIVDWIARAASEKAHLVAFAEAFLPGYPFWLSLTGGARFDDPRQKEAYRAYCDAAVRLDGPELRAIAAAAARNDIFVIVGIVERCRTASLYCTAVCIDPRRGLVGAHRKLVPTYEERLVWAPGDGHGLRAHTVAGARVGVLNCWENWMPQARHALYADGIDVHVALWPGSVRNTCDITRFVALEGRLFVLSAAAVLTRDDIPAGFPLADELPRGTFHDGGTAIAHPDGRWLVAPVARERRLVVAELDLAAVARERQNFDSTGHYGRPDVFRVDVDRERRQAARFHDG
jgi:nitrilase